MSTIVKPYTFASGALILAAEHNSNFDTIYTDYNGGITNANISASAAIATTKLSGTISPANGGTGVANNASSTITITGSFALGITLTAGTAITLPTSGTVYASGNALGTPSSGTLSSCTGLPVSTGISGLGTGVATALAVNVGSAGAPVINGGALGTPSSGTLTSCTSLPISGLTASTSTALGVGSIELGHATDTTIARSGSGVITVEGITVDTISAANALSNKTLTAPKIVSGGFIADANGNELIIMTTTASAVNEITYANAATTADPTITASGETNVSVKVAGKGTGSFYGNQETLIVAISDETTALTTGTAKLTFHMPYNFSIMKVKAGVSTVSSSGIPAFDLKDDGTSVFSTTVTIDANETFSDTAATPSVLTSTPLAVASGSVMTVNIDTAGTGTKGAKLYIIGYATAKP